MNFEKGFGFAGFLPDRIDEMLTIADDIFQEEIAIDGVVICRIDKADRIGYEEKFGESAGDAALRIVLEHSEDGSISAGLDKLSKLSKSGSAPRYVGWLLVSRMRNDISRQY